MENLDLVVFKNKKFSDILSEIYDNQKDKQKQISSLINELKPLITDIGDATLLVPLIKEYLDAGIKNDEQLIKLSQIIQKITSSGKSSEEGGSLLSEEDKIQLLREIDNLNKT